MYGSYFSKSEKNPTLIAIENCGHSFQSETGFLSKNINLAELVYFGGEMRLSMKFYFEKMRMKCWVRKVQLHFSFKMTLLALKVVLQ